MRLAGGIEEIKKAIEKLSKRHAHHLKFYDASNGLDNKRRLTGTLYSIYIYIYIYTVYIYAMCFVDGL